MTETKVQSNGTAADVTNAGGDAGRIQWLVPESCPLVDSLADVCDALPACDEFGDPSPFELAGLPTVGGVARAMQVEIRRVAAGLDTAKTLIEGYPWPEEVRLNDDQAAAQHALESLAAARAALDTLRENLLVYLGCSAVQANERLVGLDAKTFFALANYLEAANPRGLNPRDSLSRLVNAGALLMIDLKPHTWPEHSEPQSCEISPAVRRWVAGFNLMQEAIAEAWRERAARNAEAEGAVAALAVAEGGAK